MSYVTSFKMLQDAQDVGYAIGAFNAENMEMVKAIISAASELQAPVMVQTSAKAIAYGTVYTFEAMVRAEAERADIPVALHLDHGDSEELCLQCLAGGYTSIMIDGSKLPYDENKALTKKVADMARILNIPCEAELGHVGGKAEDDPSKKDIYTDPEEARQFVEETGVTSLAVSIGTSHGFYKGTPVLDVERLSEIKAAVSVPLVLHGASGLSDEQVRECARRGICKVNFATELRDAYSRTVQSYFEKKPNVVDPKEYSREAMKAVKEIVKARIIVCGSEGKAAK